MERPRHVNEDDREIIFPMLEYMFRAAYDIADEHERSDAIGEIFRDISQRGITSEWAEDAHTLVIESLYNQLSKGE